MATSVTAEVRAIIWSKYLFMNQQLCISQCEICKVHETEKLPENDIRPESFYVILLLGSNEVT